MKENMTIWRCMNKEMYYRYYFRKTLFVVVKGAKLAEAHVSSLYTKQVWLSLKWRKDPEQSERDHHCLNLALWLQQQDLFLSGDDCYNIILSFYVCSLSIWIDVYMYYNLHFVFSQFSNWYIWVQKYVWVCALSDLALKCLLPLLYSHLFFKH